jgi:hypothetical protein
MSLMFTPDTRVPTTPTHQQPRFENVTCQLRDRVETVKTSEQAVKRLEPAVKRLEPAVKRLEPAVKPRRQP